MANDINKVLNSYIEKRGSALSSILRSVGHSASSAMKSPAMQHIKSHPIRYSAGLPAMLGIGEMAGKTVNNLVHGNFTMGTPDYTAKHVVNPMANLVSTATGIGPLVADTTQRAMDGLDANSHIQQLLDVGKNITDPKVISSLKDSTIETARQAGGALGENFTSTVGGNIGATIGHEAARGIWSDLAHHPIPTIAGAAAIGAGPAIAYDMATHRRRKEEAERNKAIMRYIVRRENESPGIPKTAGYLSSMLQNLKEFKGRSLAEHIYKPSGLAGETARRLGAEAGNGVISPGVISKNIQYPQTLLNNSIIRHPLKSTLAASAVGGAGVYGLGLTHSLASQNPSEINNYDSVSSNVASLSRNVIKPGFTYIKNFEAGMAHNPEYGEVAKSQSAQKIKDIFSHVREAGKNTSSMLSSFIKNHTAKEPTSNITKGTGATGVAGNTITNRVPRVAKSNPYSFSLSEDTLDKIRKADIIGTPPEGMDEPATGVDKYLPYAGAAGLALLPFPTYMAYKHHYEDKLGKTEATNKKLQAKIETKNQQAQAQPTNTLPS